MQSVRIEVPCVVSWLETACLFSPVTVPLTGFADARTQRKETLVVSGFGDHNKAAMNCHVRLFVLEVWSP